MSVARVVLHGLEPTYEGLKLVSASFLYSSGLRRLEPTYEGLKL